MSATSGLATLTLLVQRRAALARLPAVTAVTAVTAVGSVVVGWGLAQYPWLLVDQVKISEAAGAPATLQGLLVAVGLAVVLVVPAMAYLYRITQTEAWTN